MKDLSDLELDTVGQVFALSINDASNEYDMISDNSSMVIDSGTTAHVLKDQIYFNGISRRPIGQVRVADNRLLDIDEEKDVYLNFDNGNLRLRGSYLVTKLVKNLISVSKLTDDNYMVFFDKVRVVITDSLTGEKFTGVRHDDLYYIYTGDVDQLNLVESDYKKRYRYDWENPVQEPVSINYIHTDSSVQDFAFISFGQLEYKTQLLTVIYFLETNFSLHK